MSLFKEEIATQDYVSDFYENKRYAKPYSLAYHKRWAENMLSYLDLRSPVLDLGCGTGFMAQFLNGYEAIGLDSSPKMLALAQKRYSKVVLGDAGKLPFGNSSFRTVIIKGTLHHLQDPQKALVEISRVLAGGGEAVFSEPLFNIFANLPRKKMRGTKHFSPLHKYFKEEELIRMSESAGLKIKKIGYWGFLAHFLLGFPDVIDVYRFFPFKKLFTAFFIKIDELIAEIPFLNKRLCWCITIIVKKP